jgi:ornithine carbamoyltransferase
VRHFLEVDELSPAELTRVLDLAEDPHPRPVLQGAGVALIFEKPSNRTRNATEMAVIGLGGHPVSIRGEEIGLGVRESVEDVTRVLARYHRVVAARVFDHGVLEGMARVGAVPIVNLLSDLAHPCQALADLLTLRQRWGRLAGRTVAYVGDGNNVARSLIIGCALAGVDIRLGCPAGHHPDPVAVDAARHRGGSVEVVADPAEAVKGADAVYTDVWVSLNDDPATAQERRRALAAYRLDDELLDAAAPGAIALHCLPAHPGEEITAEVLYGPRQRIWDQAENRRHAQKALLELVCGGEGDVTTG